jgi:hypothetical protein
MNALEAHAQHQAYHAVLRNEQLDRPCYVCFLEEERSVLLNQLNGVRERAHAEEMHGSRPPWSDERRSKCRNPQTRSCCEPLEIFGLS